MKISKKAKQILVGMSNERFADFAGIFGFYPAPYESHEAFMSRVIEYLERDITWYEGGRRNV